MEFERLLELVGDEPVFETALLLAGKVNPKLVRLQLTRWTKSGRVYQLRRGLYAIAPPYQKVKPHPFDCQPPAAGFVCQRAVGAGFLWADPRYCAGYLQRIHWSPGALGRRRWVVFEFRHIKPGLLRGYRMTDWVRRIRQPGQQALVATPEKALLDLVYLQPGGDTPAYLRELRLQNLERLDLDELCRQAEIFNTPKLHRAVETITRLAQSETQEYEIV